MPTDSSDEHIVDAVQQTTIPAIPSVNHGVTNSAETLARTREQYRAAGSPNGQALACCDSCFQRTLLTSINTNAHNTCNIALESFFATARYRVEMAEEFERLKIVLNNLIRRFFGGGTGEGPGCEGGGDDDLAGAIARIQALVSRISQRQEEAAELLRSICDRTHAAESQIASVVEIMRTLANTVGDIIRGRARDMQLVGSVAETIARVEGDVGRVDARIAQLASQANERLDGISERVKVIEDACTRFVVRVGAERPRGARPPRPPTPVPAVPRVPAMTPSIVTAGPRDSVSSITTQLPAYAP